jgi:hypothetical protein
VNGQHYSNFERKCVDPFFADCNKQDICPPGRIGPVENPRRCTSYYQCFQDRVQGRRDCPNNQHFIDTLNCIDPDESDCDVSQNNPVTASISLRI